MMNLGRTIKELRQNRGLKQFDFASECGLSQSYLSLIEKGAKEPTLSLLKKISATLSIPLPILVFLSLDKDDIPESKQEAFGMIESSIKGLIHNVFMAESI